MYRAPQIFLGNSSGSKKKQRCIRDSVVSGGVLWRFLCISMLWTITSLGDSLRKLFQAMVDKYTFIFCLLRGQTLDLLQEAIWASTLKKLGAHREMWRPNKNNLVNTLFIFYHSSMKNIKMMK